MALIVQYDCSFQEEDFATPREYDDYLEEIENIIYNLCHDIDVTNTNRRIDQYKRENREIIMKNKSRVGREEQELMLVLEQEKAEDEQRRLEREAIERDTQKKRIKEKEALIDELMFSYEDASKIVDGYAKQAEKTREEALALPAAKSKVEFSTGVKFGQPAQFLPVPRMEEGPLYEYEAPTIVTNGPMPPSLNEIETKGYTQHIRWVQFANFSWNDIFDDFSSFFDSRQLGRRDRSNVPEASNVDWRANVLCRRHCKVYSLDVKQKMVRIEWVPIEFIAEGSRFLWNKLLKSNL